MKLLNSCTLKKFIIQFAEIYHQYKTDADKLRKTKYSICSNLEYYKNTGLIQLSYNDKPGDLLPPLSIKEIKNTPDVISGLHPIDVNTINDLFYLSQDKISQLIINENKIQVTNQCGEICEYDINVDFANENLVSKRVSFLIGYMQAEKLLKENYILKDKYKIIKDNITTLSILNIETNEQTIRTPLDILFSKEYEFFSKEDVSKIGFICGQMANLNHSNDRIA